MIINTFSAPNWNRDHDRTIGGFCTDRISSSGSIGLKKETGKNWFLFVKNSRQVQMRQILASFSVFKRYEKFVKTNEFKFW